MNLNTEQYFSEVPQIHAPRSIFDRSFTHKTTMDVNKLYPIFIDEVLPGDSMKLTFQAFGRLVDPLVVPIMDELYFETLWFKCPMRLLWTNSFKFFGERENPSDSTDYVIPTITSGANGFGVDSLADHFGIPPLVAYLTVNSLPFRMYNLVFNTWLRDQNLINSVTVPLDDSDDVSNYTILKSAKMHDVFTSALVSTQLGDPVQLSLGTTAPVSIKGTGKTLGLTNGSTNVGLWSNTSSENNRVFSSSAYDVNASNSSTTATGFTSGYFGVTTDATKSGLTGTADLSQATGVNVNDLRFLIKLQQYREKLLTGGHRYREIVSNFFNVDQLDNNVYIPEFLGMTREMVDINSVVQTSSSDSVSPQGFVTAYGMVSSHESGFSTSSVEHGYIMGLARFRYNPVYQQGLNKLWSRSVQLDFYNPMFNGLGEQPILNKEIVCQGASVLNSAGEPVDDDAFGFQEAWYEYRYYPSIISGQLRSGIPQSLDVYHLAQYFGTYDSSTQTYSPSLPVLNQSFIEENIPMDRVLAVNNDNYIPQFVMDFRFNYICARPMPVHNVPAGLTSGI